MTQPVEESSWHGLISGRRQRPVVVQMRMRHQMAADRSTAGAFQAADMSGRRWWVKPQHQGNLDAALATEFIVSKLGHLIGAPTCENVVFEVTRDFEREEYKPGKLLRAGLGHATAEVPDAKEERPGDRDPGLDHRSEDSNASRHVGIFALYDWAWGYDEQWLVSRSNENTTYSHDHGWYLPPAGPSWTPQALREVVDEPHPLGQTPAGLDPSTVDKVALALEDVSREAIAAILRQVPHEWPATDSELETLGWFLERRSTGVAERLRALI